MKDKEDSLRNLQHSLEQLRGTFHILETKVPVEKQMEYFHFSEYIKKQRNQIKRSVEESLVLLYAEETLLELKKELLVELAGLGSVEAFRALEAYVEQADEKISHWAALALMEARVSLNAALSDEKQIFISTGLGGKGSSLRYFALFKSTGLQIFSTYQKELIEREFSYSIEKNKEGEVESLHVGENYISLLFLYPLQGNIKKVLDEAVTECNQYGDFIQDKYMVTNVKLYTEEEIRREIEKSKE